MRGLLIGCVGALALYGVCDLALRGWDRFRGWWSIHRRRRSLRLAKRLNNPTPPFPWAIATALSLFIIGMVAIGLSIEPGQPAPPRLGEEIRFQQVKVVAQSSRPMRMEATRYHWKYTGRPTASGEIYDPAKLTAAHRNYAFGDVVEVDGPSGSVTVRINDRGPWCEHGPTCKLPCHRADIDLSESAARALGIYEAGRAIVMARRRL